MSDEFVKLIAELISSTTSMEDAYCSNGRDYPDKQETMDNARSALLSRIAEVETERDDLLKILKDPFAVHTNILIGRIALPDYYIRKTDSDGEYAHLETERDEWRRIATSLAEEYSPCDPYCHTDGCPRRRFLQGVGTDKTCTCDYEAKFATFRALEAKYPAHLNSQVSTDVKESEG